MIAPVDKTKKSNLNAKFVYSEDCSTKQQTLNLRQAIDLAVQHHTAGDLGKAEEIYQQILETNPNKPVALHLLGVIFHQNGENDTAVDLITRALEYKPDYAEAHSNLGNVFRELGRLDEAIASCYNALDFNPDFAEAYNNLGSALKELGKLGEAITSFHNALTINSEYAKAHSNLAMLHYSIKQGKETIHHLLKAVEMFEKTGDELMGNNAKGLLKDCFKEFRLTAEECQTL